ncbi:signal transduction histidine kinase [Nitrospirillum amazonense]|uniref:histidine kinase n=1 Tax=Nitrospirillum amazonense TaxID=28077 RepID=A0A560K3B9_9PROT|nr:HAMP domain-containing sensor histidine kinase [Nitrospirillum amazonense]TWB77845.1 signal transduction histidine kinase [Nitrospirillum amazonense]
MTPSSLTTSSLTRRLFLLSVLWIAPALVITGIILTDLFRTHAEAELSRRMAQHLDELAAVLEVTPDGAVALARDLSDPRFRRPLSGLYWRVDGPGDRVLRSRSLWDQALDLPADTPKDGEVHRHSLTGPNRAPLVAWERSLRLPGAATPVRAAVIVDASDVQAATAGFSRVLGVSLALLAAGLLAAAAVQVRLGLGPLRRMRAALADLRAGRSNRLEGAFPGEVQPVVDDLNLLMEENRTMVERARAQAADLAHALKTPLAVIANAAAAPGGMDPAVVAAEAERMRGQIERHLARARAAPTLLHSSGGTVVLPVLRQIARTVARLHTERGVDIQIDGDARARVRADPVDLQEMAGNLIDNAAKWCTAVVRVTAVAAGGGIVITVQDDGPGIPADRRSDVLARGARLDEAVPGSGLGLTITEELARLHGGSLSLETSPTGGLSVSLHLPQAAR